MKKLEIINATTLLILTVITLKTHEKALYLC